MAYAAVLAIWPKRPEPPLWAPAAAGGGAARAGAVVVEAERVCWGAARGGAAGAVGRRGAGPRD